ncbi:hypothetical protein MarSH_178 [Marseillevirus Shanghai 1]|nr:hypothetical protein MarSH_178 [Marseillevirus Shanghai 1]
MYVVFRIFFDLFDKPLFFVVNGKCQEQKKITEPFLVAWTLLGIPAGFVIGRGEGRNQKNRHVSWYVGVPKVVWRAICWPYYVREYI